MSRRTQGAFDMIDFDPPRIKARVTFTDPAEAVRRGITVEARWLSWDGVRDCAMLSGCSLSEERIGLITKKFVIRGDEAALARFIDEGWKMDLPGFRAACRQKAKE